MYHKGLSHVTSHFPQQLLAVRGGDRREIGHIDSGRGDGGEDLVFTTETKNYRRVADGGGGKWWGMREARRLERRRY